MNEEMAGRIFDIQKFSIHDGPGIRTLVFFKGCPLRCLWCSNPESQESVCELMYSEQRCAFCGKCVEACPSENIELVEGSPRVMHKIDREECRGCRECVKACPNDALKVAGSDMSVDDVFSVILQDYLFYLNSNGGVTLGGGEPAMQPEFARELLRRCKQNDIHTAIETCGHVGWNVLESLIEYLDLVFFDIKHMNSDKHKTVTGASNERILKNAKRLLKVDVPIIIRIPIVTGINDNEENLVDAMKFLVRHNTKDAIQRIELLPYHKLGVNKYRRLGRTCELHDLPRPSPTFLEQADLLVRSFGFTSEIEEIRV